VASLLHYIPDFTPVLNLAKKVKLTLIGSPLRAFQWA